MSKALVALLTDFGTKDYFVASIKGVILSINPEASITDITHEIPGFEIQAASFILWACYRFFPRGTIFLVVVDPGVGSNRHLVLAKTDRHIFIAPDNGVLTLIFNQEKPEVYEILGKDYFIFDRKTTFEARDKMAPVAAWLSLGVPLSELARPTSSVKELELSQPQLQSKEIQGCIIYRDKFGNLITNINQYLISQLLDRNRGANPVLTVGKKKISEMASTYSSSSAEKPFFMINSLGLLEIAVYKKPAAEILGLEPGEPVVLRVD